MHAFIIPANTPIKVIRANTEWRAENFRDAKTTKENFFFAEDLHVDPTGISKTASVPGTVTVGSAWANAGWFGFLRAGENWYCLVQSKHVQMG